MTVSAGQTAPVPSALGFLCLQSAFVWKSSGSLCSLGSLCWRSRERHELTVALTARGSASPTAPAILAQRSLCFPPVASENLPLPCYHTDSALPGRKEPGSPHAGPPSS